MLEQKVCHLKQTNFYTKLNVALSWYSQYLLPFMFLIFIVLNFVSPLIGYVSIYKMIYTLVSIPIIFILFVIIFAFTVHNVRKHIKDKKKLWLSILAFPFLSLQKFYTVWIIVVSFIKKKIFKWHNPFVVTKKTYILDQNKKRAWICIFKGLVVLVFMVALIYLSYRFIYLPYHYYPISPHANNKNTLMPIVTPSKTLFDWLSFFSFLYSWMWVFYIIAAYIILSIVGMFSSSVSDQIKINSYWNKN
jgi:hypothetical protein